MKSKDEIESISERPQTLGEEIANSISHGIGAFLAIAAIPVFLYSKWDQSYWSFVGAAIFSVTALLLYTASTLFHALARNRAKKVFQILDHSAIYLLIAGTYTPFALGPLRGNWGWPLFIVLWSLAILGVIIKSLGGIRYNKLSTAVYLLMGWMILFVIKPAWSLIPHEGLFWLLMGGLAYTIGVVFFVFERRKYFHFLWHIAVMAGTICHFFAVLWYAT